MRTRLISQIREQICDAALRPESWSVALQSVCESLGAVGAAYIVRSKPSGRVEWISLFGPCTEMQADYVRHYSELDPYSPLLEVAPNGQSLCVSDCLSRELLRRDEWYNDFILKCGVSDILGARLADSDKHSIILGLHRGIDQSSFKAGGDTFSKLLPLLCRAAQMHSEVRELSQKASVAFLALDQLAAGVGIAEADGTVIEMNKRMEAIVRRQDGLAVRNNRLAAMRSFENSRLAAALSGTSQNPGPAISRMLIGRPDGRMPYVLSIAPLSPVLTGSRQRAMVLIVDPEWRTSSEQAAAEMYGLTLAETRIASGLMSGKTLGEIAHDRSVAITTVRTQLQSLMRKAGADRQSDLVRILSGIGFATEKVS